MASESSRDIISNSTWFSPSVTAQDFRSYLQVSLHERRPGLHQVVTDAPLTGRGGLVERRLASETHSVSVNDTFEGGWKRFGQTGLQTGLTSLSPLRPGEMWALNKDRKKTSHQLTVWRKWTSIFCYKVSHRGPFWIHYCSPSIFS